MHKWPWGHRWPVFPSTNHRWWPLIGGSDISKKLKEFWLRVGLWKDQRFIGWSIECRGKAPIWLENVPVAEVEEKLSKERWEALTNCRWINGPWSWFVDGIREGVKGRLRKDDEHGPTEAVDSPLFDLWTVYGGRRLKPRFGLTFLF